MTRKLRNRVGRGMLPDDWNIDLKFLKVQLASDPAR